jgi:hypothetical protein
MKYIKAIILFSVIGILSGCSLFITTAENQYSRKVVIIPKQEPITNISKVEIHFKGLNLTPEQEKENFSALNDLLIAKLKEAKLYQVNGDMNGDVIRILVKKVDENLMSNDLQAFVIILNAKGESVASGVYIERGDGYHGADYYREEFVTGLVKYIKEAPVVEQKPSQEPAPTANSEDATSQNTDSVNKQSSVSSS